jgi:uncharacterized protein YbgA (DUF1722 family)/uncharacterized protein YbbK (DUF523 family)
MQNKLKIGISACLAGQEVRFDKSHKRSNFCMDVLTEFVDFQPFCPEMAVGLPTPRPTVRQIQKNDIITVSRPDGSGDITEALQAYGKKVAEHSSHLSGFVFCAKSPSCGMERVKVYSEDGKKCEKQGVGLFAEQIMKHNPNLPCEENGRLNDPLLRENFILRVFVYQQWQQVINGNLTKSALFEFHASNKYLLMAHHVASYKQLGRLLAQSTLDIEELADQYITGLMSALKNRATRKTHANTMYHLMGYFKKELNKEQKSELLDHIEQYRAGLLPLLAPLTLFKHYLRTFPKTYLINQRYFDPYPVELKLRYGY